MKTETRNFSMHPALLMDVIKRQAGTLSKAILEGVMNSVDAGATKMSIELTSDKVNLGDDGRGFRNRQEIEQWFEVFGQPHEESEAKRYGTFRMGRGQMFAFGRNRWDSGTFHMDVDIKECGLAYELEESPSTGAIPGCAITIELYEELTPSVLQMTTRDMERWVKYVPIPVHLNGRQISKPAEGESWDLVTDEAYFRFKQTGLLTFYNLGVYVCDFPASKFGVAGEVVSKKQLKVNFARNDIQSDCPAWRKITPRLTEAAGRKVQRKRALTDDDRQWMVDQILSGDMQNAADASIFTDVTGVNWSLRRIESWMRRNRVYKITEAPHQSPVGDKLMQQRLAFVLSPITLERFHVETIQELHEKLSPWDPIWKVTLLHNLVKDFNESYQVLDENQWTPTMVLIMDMLNRRHYDLAINRLVDRWPGRKLVIGVSNVAAAWTDGESYIAMHKKFFGTRDMGYEEWHEIGHLTMHEYCHHDPSMNTHVHGKEFYEEYHNHHKLLARFVKACCEDWPNIMERAGKKLGSKALRMADRDHAGNKAGKALSTCLDE